MSIQELQQKPNQDLLILLKENNLPYPDVWTENERNVAIVRLNHLLNKVDPTPDPVQVIPVSVIDICEKLKQTFPNCPLCLKNVNTWTNSDLMKAKALIRF